MSRKIAILGGGRIGEALLAGLLSSGWREPSEVVVTSRRDERVAELRFTAQRLRDGLRPGRAAARVEVHRSGVVERVHVPVGVVEMP